MSKKFIGILFFSVMFLSVYGQGEKRNRFAFLLSPELSWMNSDHNAVNSNGSVFGFNFGLSYDRFFDKNYAFTTGIFINGTGGKLTYRDYTLANVGGELIEVTDLDYKLKYLEIPLGIRLLTNDFRRIRFYMDMGIYTQFNIKAIDGNGKSLTEEVKVFDLGYNIGGGVEYSVGGDTYLIFGLKYYGGFTDITSNYTVDDKTILNGLEFRFGVIF